MYSSQGLLLQNFSTQQFLIIKCYKDPFFLPEFYGIFRLCIIQQRRHLLFFQDWFVKETRLQIMPIINVKYNTF